MLAFARRETVEPQSIDLARVLPSLREMLCHAAGPTIECQVQVEKGVAPILADRHQLEVALLNLAVNARDALPDGGKLTISAANLDAGAPQPTALGSTAAVVINVSDNGIGMDAETVRRALEPFFTTKSIGQGTGLGLAQVHGFVTRASGALSIESEPGTGTTISLFFPKSTLEAVERGKQPEPAMISDTSSVVLLVDDDDQVRPLAATQLRDLGHTVIEAASGAVALTLAELHKIDVLVTDVAMPDMDGPRLAARMRSRLPKLPVIYVTGFAGDRDLGDWLVIEKPFRSEVLARTIAEALTQD